MILRDSFFLMSHYSPNETDCVTTPDLQGILCGKDVTVFHKTLFSNKCGANKMNYNATIYYCY